MTGRAIVSSLGLHGAAVAAIWLGCLTGQPGGPEEIIWKEPAVRLVPPKGRPPERVKAKRPGEGRREPPGSPVDLDGVTLTIDDAAAQGMMEVLRTWKGQVTDCSADPRDQIRFWLYQPEMWTETASLEGIPCADFPPPFRAELQAMISERAQRERISAVRSATIGFVPGMPGGVRIVRIGG